MIILRTKHAKFQQAQEFAHENNSSALSQDLRQLSTENYLIYSGSDPQI